MCYLIRVRQWQTADTIAVSTAIDGAEAGTDSTNFPASRLKNLFRHSQAYEESSNYATGWAWTFGGDTVDVYAVAILDFNGGTVDGDANRFRYSLDEATTYAAGASCFDTGTTDSKMYMFEDEIYTGLKVDPPRTATCWTWIHDIDTGATDTTDEADDANGIKRVSAGSGRIIHIPSAGGTKPTDGWRASMICVGDLAVQLPEPSVAASKNLPEVVDGHGRRYELDWPLADLDGEERDVVGRVLGDFHRLVGDGPLILVPSATAAKSGSGTVADANADPARRGEVVRFVEPPSTRWSASLNGSAQSARFVTWGVAEP